MILSCNSCGKKFVVPDNAIGATGRLVQCSSCGNKWKQFPTNNNNEIKSKQKISKIKSTPKKIQRSIKTVKKKVRKKTGPDLYSPEYLAKKHGIKIDSNPNEKINKSENTSKISFGFYSYITVLIIVTISVLRLLYFTQNIIIEKIPFLEVYINYLFESLNNIKDITQNFFSN